LLIVIGVQLSYYWISWISVNVHLFFSFLMVVLFLFLNWHVLWCVLQWTIAFSFNLYFFSILLLFSFFCTLCTIYIINNSARSGRSCKCTETVGVCILHEFSQRNTVKHKTRQTQNIFMPCCLCAVPTKFRDKQNVRSDYNTNKINKIKSLIF